MGKAINWDKVEEENQSSFKPYAEAGTYEVKLDSVTQKTAGTGTIFFEFNIEEDEDVQYPKISRSLFKDEKLSFRIHHYKEIMKVLGASEENARKAVEVCEGKANREAIADAYTQAFNRLAQKHPKIKLEVSSETNGDKTYARGEFADPSVHFSNNKKPAAKPADVLPDEGEVSEDGEVSLDEIPF